MDALTLRSLIKKEKINGSNFLDRHQNLRITLKYEGKLHHIDTPLHNPHAANATHEQLQKEMDDRIAFDMIDELKNMFQTQESQEFFDTQRKLNACKIEDGQSVSFHVLKTKSCIDKLERLGHPMLHVLAVNTVFETLEKEGRKFQGKDESSTALEEREHSKGCRVLPLCKNKTLEEDLSLLPCRVKARQACMIGMRSNRRPKKGAMVIHLRNENCADVEAIGSYFLNDLVAWNFV
ncbi:hypothetical protein Tco_0552015 [Tanacetum coccineum]